MTAGTRTSRTARFASIALIAATMPAVYFVVGDLSEPGEARYLDYVWKPPSWSNTTITVVGVLALVTMAISLATLIRERRDGRASRAVIKINAVLVIATALSAWSYRVMTAGGSGANIGAGLVMLFITPLVLSMLLAAVVIAFRSRKRSSQT